MSTASVEQKQQDLINGYINNHYCQAANNNDTVPSELNNIILQFLGDNTFLVFDIVADEGSKQYIHDHGKCIKGIGVEKTTKIGCSLPLNKDFRKIDIKCVKGVEDTDNVIGIISNIDECKNKTWWYQMKGYKYWWQNRMVILSQDNITEINRMWFYEQQWKSNDIISITIDCNQWIITFYLNNKKKFEMPLQKDINLYLMITSHGDFEYQLLP